MPRQNSRTHFIGIIEKMISHPAFGTPGATSEQIDAEREFELRLAKSLPRPLLKVKAAFWDVALTALQLQAKFAALGNDERIQRSEPIMMQKFAAYNIALLECELKFMGSLGLGAPKKQGRGALDGKLIVEVEEMRARRNISLSSACANLGPRYGKSGEALRKLYMRAKKKR